MILPVVRALDEAGLPAATTAAKLGSLDRCARMLSAGASADVLRVVVPGRIEVLGKHTDYAGGRSVLCAAEQGFVFVARPRTDDRLVVRAVDMDDVFECPLDPAIEPALGHWSNYPATVVRRVARNFPTARRGLDLAFSSDLPPAAGMSSSSALMIGVFVALASVNRLSETDDYRTAVDSQLALAAYAATIENGRTFRGLAGDRGVGTFGGSEDHTAILSCRPGRLSCYAFGPVRLIDDVAVPEPWVFVVAISGVVAEKTRAARELYNRTSRRAADALAAWNLSTGRQDETLDQAVASAPDARDRLLAILTDVRTGEWPAEVLVNRVRQFCLESLDVIPSALTALSAGDMAAFGRAVEASQRAAEEWLENQVPETAWLASSGVSSGAAAASAFGGGFGGGVWALVRRDDAAAFAARWAAGYRERFPEAAARASFLITRPGPAAFVLQ